MTPPKDAAAACVVEPIAYVPPMAARLPRPKHLKPELARAAYRAREAAGLTQSQLALQVATQQPNAHHWEQANEPNAPTVLHVAAGPGVWAAQIIRWQAGRHQLAVYAEAAIVHGDDHAARLAALTVELTDVPRVFANALRDNDLSDEELETLACEARECIEAARELEAWTTRELQSRREARHK